MLTDSDILSIISQELSNCTKNTGDLEKALAYYNGDPNGKEVEGRSSLTSTDVADAIEWIMPEVMQALTQGHDVVSFDPSAPGDELQAELETDYVKHVIFKQNDGFIKLHTFTKDALLHRNGIFKVYVEDYEEPKVYSLTGLAPIELQMLVADKSVEVISFTENEDGTSDVSYKNTSQQKRVCIECVPLEQFRINNQHNTINANEARFTAHIVPKELSELASMGFDEDTLSKIPEYVDYKSDFRFRSNNDNTRTRAADPAQKPVELIECFMRLDINEDGIAEYVKILAAGDENTASVLLSYEEIDCGPWVTGAAILMSHKFEGKSIYDRLKELQDQSTTLLRNVFDNIYFQNNARFEAVENLVNLDDLMTNTPGGIVRVKKPGSVLPIVTPQLSPITFELFNRLDRTKAGRTGVEPDGTMSPQQLGDRVGSQGVNQLMTAKQALVGLIVRVIAETGLKPLALKVRRLLVEHVDTISDYKFRDNWVKVHPARWQNRDCCSVNVGTGSGNTESKLFALQAIFAIQEKLLAAPQLSLVTPTKVYQALNAFCKLQGFTGADMFFVDPAGEEGKQLIQQQAMQQQQMSQMQQQMAQMQAQLEQQKVQNDTIRSQAQAQKVAADAQIAVLKHKLEDSSKQFEQMKDLQESLHNDKRFQFDKYQADLDAAIRLTEIESKIQTEENKNFNQNRGDVSEQSV